MLQDIHILIFILLAILIGFLVRRVPFKEFLLYTAVLVAEVTILSIVLYSWTGDGDRLSFILFATFLIAIITLLFRFLIRRFKRQ